MNKKHLVYFHGKEKRKKRDIKIKINKAFITTQVSEPSLYQFLVLIK
jgi:hypothetical protein